MTKEEKQYIANRAKGRCEYCQSLRKYSPQPFCIDHVVPRSKGGTDSPQNCAYSCGGCNAHKYNKLTGVDPISGLSVELFHPRSQDWKTHFSWDESFTMMVGITPTGRATIQALRLNRYSLTQIRLITLLTGEHPP